MPYNVNTRIGQASLKKEIYEPIIKYLADHKVRTFGEVISALTGKEQKDNPLNESQVYEALRTLTLLGTLQPALTDQELNPEVVKNCQEFNRNTILSQTGAPVNYFACPVIQGGMYVNVIVKQLLEIYLRDPKSNEQQMTDYIEQELKKHKQFLNKDGKPVTDAQEQHKMISDMVHKFHESTLPLFKALKMF